jgi:hypothetical protein
MTTSNCALLALYLLSWLFVAKRTSRKMPNSRKVTTGISGSVNDSSKAHACSTTLVCGALACEAMGVANVMVCF